jgi:hypothetical protein
MSSSSFTNAAPRPPDVGLAISHHKNGILRIRYSNEAGKLLSLNERSGYVEPGATRHHEKDGFTTDPVEGDPFSIQLKDPSGNPVTTLTLRLESTGGFKLIASSKQDDARFGLGFHRKKIDLSGQTLRWERRFRHDGATVPFFFSTAGYGVFSNNPYNQTFDFTQPLQWSLEADTGDCDVFFIYGPSPKEILDGYTRLCGRPQLPPRWAFDVFYICRYFEDQTGVETLAKEFRARDIPCGMMGLEPGWEEKPYSMDWKWSQARFPNPQQMIKNLHAAGYFFKLWESGAAPERDFVNPAVRAEWFQKRVSQSLALGVDFFKQDDPYPRGIMSQELQPGVERVVDQLTPEEREAWNISNSLYSETVIKGIEDYHGKRAIILFNSYFASVAAHRWPTAWAADFPSGTGLANASLSAHAMVSRDMETATPAGIHFGYLCPLSLIDAWAYYKEPWLYPPHLEAMHRFYAKLRMRLGPHLYSAAWRAHTTGLPIMRPLILEHPEDRNVFNLSSQHYLGDGLLAGQGNQIYLPHGRWINYWTGAEQISAGESVAAEYSEPAGGPLWVREGSILITKPVTPHAFAEEDTVLIAEVFPSDQLTVTSLYEDEGTTLNYRDGVSRLTEFSCQSSGRDLKIDIRLVRDALASTSFHRSYLLKIHTPLEPTFVSWAGRELPRVESREQLLRTAGQRGWAADESAPYVWIKMDANWHFTSDARGANDPERDTPVWLGSPENPWGELAVTFGSRPLFIAAKSESSGSEFDQVRVMLNPPERIPFLEDPTWLPKQTTVYAWLELNCQPAMADGVSVSLDVLSENGEMIRSESQLSQKGRATFPAQPYEPGVTRFRVRVDKLSAAEASVRPSSPISC